MATVKGKIIPSRLRVPWTVFAACNWFEVEGENPSSGLLHVKPHLGSDWKPGAMISLAHCFPMNLVYWPSSPFNEHDYDKHGTYSGSQVANAKYSNRITIDYDNCKLYDVITHHEKGKLSHIL